MPAVSYDAHREEMLYEMTRKAPVPAGPEVLLMPDTALRSFERAPESLRTEFNAWMTREEKERVSFLDDIFKRYATPIEQIRNMNYIVWMESVHPMGSKKVAALAFNRMFEAKDGQVPLKK